MIGNIHEARAAAWLARIRCEDDAEATEAAKAAWDAVMEGRWRTI
jgi:hypothetical protein